MADRAPHFDEAEALQGGYMMRQGLRIYRDFAEHHPPFLQGMLAAFAPGEERASNDEIRKYVLRARAVVGLFGCIALVAGAAFVRSTSGRGAAAILFGAILLANPALWIKAFADVRAEPASLAFFWLGTVLVVIPRGEWKASILHGFGLALLVTANFWNPKWPLGSMVVGLFYVQSLFRDGPHRIQRAVVSLVVAGCGSAVTIFWLLKLTDFGSLFAHTFELSRALFAWSAQVQLREVAQGTASGIRAIPFLYCPPMLRPMLLIPAALLVVAVAMLRPNAFHNRRGVALVLLVAAASLVEIRFLYPYPALWVQYYAQWAMAGVAILALLSSALVSLLPTDNQRRTVWVLVVALALVGSLNIISPRSVDSYWGSSALMRKALGANGTIWMDMTRRPIGTREANHYWFGLRDFIPAALQFAKTPRGAAILPPLTESDLPPCRLERGLEPHLRFLPGESSYRQLPIVAQCFSRLRARGVVARSPTPDIYMVIGSHAGLHDAE